MNERHGMSRMLVVASLLVLALLGLGGQLAYLHLGPHETLRAKVDESRAWEADLTVERGRILDRGGLSNILALDLAVKDVCADPKVICTNLMVEPVAAVLSEALAQPRAVLAERLNRPDRRFALLKASVPIETAETLRARKLQGVFFRDSRVRYYPHSEFLCHVLGFVNRDGQGSAGIEQKMDRFLRGSPGRVEGEKDGRRQEIRSRREQDIPALEGADVVLTIDQNIQYIVETELEAVMKEHHAAGAWAMVQRVRTGEILAMASRPGYDLNAFRSAPDGVKLNRAIGVVYEPGSTFKAIVFAAALQEGLVTPATVFDCENGSWLHRGKILRDYHPYGRLTVADGIQKSSNIMSAKLSILLGDHKLYDYMRAFGVGQALGVDLPGEEQGLLRPLQDWSGISGSRMAIGQGVAVTAVTMMGIYCSIANDGALMRPYLIDRVVGRDGTVLYKQFPEKIGQPLKPETAELMRRLLRRVTLKEGTGHKASVPGYSVAGKTGTAQKAVAGGYSSSQYVGSFVGFVPAGTPEIGLIVVVDEPQPYHTGGVVAAPAFGRIASQIVRYLGIQPDEEQAPATALVKR